jgi:uncharacterized protein YsxB (DUF464 family)
MTEIMFDPSKLSLEVNGHAGYAEPGKDIVCAGISALVLALPAQFDHMGIKYKLDMDEQKGLLKVNARPSSQMRYICYTVFNTIYAGLVALAQHYPEYVKIKKEE